MQITYMVYFIFRHNLQTGVWSFKSPVIILEAILLAEHWNENQNLLGRGLFCADKCLLTFL